MLRTLISCKFVLFFPKKSDVVIWGAPRFIKLLKNKKYIPVKKKISLIHTWGESINLSILLKCILKFRLNLLNYSEEYLKYTKPKIIISFLDNYETFYKLKSEKKQIKILIQNAWRSDEQKFFEKKNLILKSNVDYILTQNYPIIKKYQILCKADIRPIGSFLSNNSNHKYNKKKFDILYVSTFRNNKKNAIINKNISLSDYIDAETRLIKNIFKYCKKKNIKFYVLPTNPNKDQEIEEKIFFNNLLGKEKNWSLLARKADDFNYAYNVIDQSKVVVGIDSTLLYESFGRGTKTIFFDIRPNNSFLKKRRHFAWPKKFNQEGPFWCSVNNPDRIHKLISKVSSINNSNWKKIKLKYEKDLMVTDKGNSILQKIIKKNLIK